ncbi:Hsp20/alpha crystallin family protein [Anoxybacteroides tepidamans]|uniref:Hsp20/alpha crystallin family protein n=1 Tax=Anoxybacteroides tepidamans TaxID=265948 RepID=UPI000489BB6E|nr:Hsp20/alpha crystallin family protein [Anoxybacillus tepidamans]
MFPFLSFFPFQEGIQKWLRHTQASDIEQHVQRSIAESIANSMHMYEQNTEMLKRLFTPSRSSSPHRSHPKLDIDVFETHDDIYVKIPLSSSSMLDTMKIFYTSNQLIIEGIPSPDDRHTITLPSLVKKRGASTSYKEGVLQIKIPKRVDFQFTEIDVPNLD